MIHYAANRPFPLLRLDYRVVAGGPSRRLRAFTRGRAINSTLQVRRAQPRFPARKWIAGARGEFRPRSWPFVPEFSLRVTVSAQGPLRINKCTAGFAVGKLHAWEEEEYCWRWSDEGVSEVIKVKC